jgi:imidazolonepropionase-like amidohydrolase
MKLLGILIGCGLAAGAASNNSVLIRGADVYPVTSAPVRGVSILVLDGKIAEIGAKIVAPKGVRVVEGRGLRVYPGMIDSGTQMGLSEISAIRETVDTGELGEFMPQLRALASVNPESEHFAVARIAGITAVMTLPAGSGGGGGGRSGARQYISGQAALIHTFGWTWEDMAVTGTAAMYVQFPTLGAAGGRGGAVPDFVAELAGEAGARTFTEMTRTYQQEVAKLADFFDEARRYQKAKAANLPGLVRDLKYEAMLPVLDGKVPVAIAAATPRAIHDAIQFADKQPNVRIVILQPRELGSAAAELKAKNIPVVLGRVLALPRGQDDPYDQAFTLPAEAYKAGIKFAFGTFDNEFVRNLPYQAATAVAFGLPQDEALKAITINPAQIWGAGSQLGSIEKDKSADLMVTTGDPLEIQTQVKHIFIRGQEVELSSKQTRLYDKYLNRQ